MDRRYLSATFENLCIPPGQYFNINCQLFVSGKAAFEDQIIQERVDGGRDQTLAGAIIKNYDLNKRWGILVCS